MGSNKQTPSIWQITHEELYSDCRIFKVFKRHCKHPSNKEGDFFVIRCEDWVQVLALTPPPFHLVMIRQYRFGSDKISWEVPGGVIDGAEGPIGGGVRELTEETGYVGKKAQLIGSCFPNPATNTNQCHFVLIENCELKRETQWDPFEEIEVEAMPIEKAFHMLENGLIEHALTINALVKLQIYLKSHPKI
ncbi:MAG: hypothetical protein A2007_03600 [Verrucomicrobia bacterium GWC2_42_7]|nr:MAG: hypothetical protein A2007_03600 [Verrucomicrobia bacterium GWC2_42_7]